MPVFDFSDTPVANEHPECTYETFHSTETMASALDSSMLNNEIALAAEHENYIRQNESLIEKAEQKEVITICKFDSELKKQQDTTNRKFNEEFKSVDNTYKKQVEELHQKAGQRKEEKI